MRRQRLLESVAGAGQRGLARKLEAKPRPSQLLARAVGDQRRLKRKLIQEKKRKMTTKTKYICL